MDAEQYVFLCVVDILFKIEMNTLLSFTAHAHFIFAYITINARPKRNYSCVAHNAARRSTLHFFDMRIHYLHMLFSTRLVRLS